MDEETIFLEALQKPTLEERLAFVAQACAGNGELRRGVERLLQAHDRAGHFLHPPPGLGPTIDHAGVERPGTVVDRPGAVIGAYTLLEQIGEGGFGIVFMAEQQHPVRRKVALKILKPGMDTRQVVGRFEAERQALALMDHPNIARVFDGGETAGGRPYFVMELVRGMAITDHCDQNRLTPRQRLELFIPVCLAVQHAHHKGVIHRDIKPSNVLVTLHDGAPVVKVIDFGIAKAVGQQLTDKTLITHLGQMVGTPLYMSPEQAGLSGMDVDTRSDIYSLGVLLYELLTGTTPFEKEQFRQAGYDEIRRIIREVEPPRPSARIRTLRQAATPVAGLRKSDPKRLSRLFHGDLDWVVMKCLEKDRDRRYESANSLALDLQHYLVEEPVAAGPPSAAYRLRKYVRRHRVGLAMTAAAALVLLLGTGGVGWVLWDQAARRNEQATRRLETEGAVKAALVEAVALEDAKKWPEALEAAKRAQGLLAADDSEELRQRVSEVLKDLNMVLTVDQIRLPQAVAGKEGAFDDAAADAAYATAFREYGIDVESLEPGEAAERIRGRVIRLELTVALDDWANKRDRNNPSNDLRWKRLVAVSRAADPDEWRNQIRDALEQRKTETLNKLAASPRIGDQPLQTLSLLANHLGAKDGEVVLRQAQQKYPDDFWINFQLAWDLEHQQPPQREEAIRFYTVALALHPRNVPTHVQLGAKLQEQGKLDEAIAVYSRAVELDPKSAELHNSLGDALAAKKRLDEAVGELRTASELKAAELYNNLGNALLAKKQWDEAAGELRTAIELDPKNAAAHCRLGHVLREQGQFAAALQELRQGHELGSRSPDWHYPSAQWVQDAERLVERDRRLPAILEGKEQPADDAERLALAELCQQPFKMLYAASARLYAEAFAHDARLADDLQAGYRSNAAAAAALAAAGKGKDADPLDDTQRRQLRRQALEWLRAELAARRRLLEQLPSWSGAAEQQPLRQWQQYAAFAGVRGDALARLPEAERQPWQEFWADVEQTLTVSKTNPKGVEDAQKKPSN